MEGLTLQFCALSALLLRKNVKNGLHLYNCLHYLVDILENHDTGSLLLRIPQPEPRGGARVCASAAVLGVAARGVGGAYALRRALRGDPAHAVADGADCRGFGICGVVGDEEGEWRICHLGSQKSAAWGWTWEATCRVARQAGCGRPGGRAVPLADVAAPLA